MINVGKLMDSVTREATATCQGDQANNAQSRNVQRILLTRLAAMNVCELGGVLQRYRQRRPKDKRRA